MKQRSPLLPIFLIVLIDILGYTIVLPILALYAKRFGASAIVATSLVSVYALCSLLSAPVLGRLSDRFGRKPLLLISQIGTCIGFIVIGAADSLWLIFVGRILDGATAGNLAIAQAYVSDHTAAKDRTKAFALIGIAFGVGFTFGPFMAAQLADYGQHAPFYAAAGLSATSILATLVILPNDRLAPKSGAPADLPAGRRPSIFDIDVYRAFFRKPDMASLLLQFFLFSFAFSCFTSGFALFGDARFGWTARETGYLFAFSGFLGIILQGGIIGRLVKKFGDPPLAWTAFATAVAGYAILGAATSLAVLLVAAVILAYGNGILRPVITSLVSQSATKQDQGSALGVAQSLGSIAMIVAPLVGGALIDRLRLLEWGLVMASTCALGGVIAWRFRHTHGAAIMRAGSE